MSGRRLISSDESTARRRQHDYPCSDCPFRRESLPGWLGRLSVRDWLAAAHGEATIECHALHHGVGGRRVGPLHCAGAAIYRANVGKRLREPRFVLPRDEVVCFASPREFEEHHRSVEQIDLAGYNGGRER